MKASLSHVDGNAAGELNTIFAVDITKAKGQCANCGVKAQFAEAHVYTECPGLIARCASCGHVLLRLVNAGERVFLDVSGMTCLRFER
jgi:Family of unknown function (DUF6510)